MWSDLDSREDDVDRGPIPLDIDNVHLLLQGASFSSPSPDTHRQPWERGEGSTLTVNVKRRSSPPGVGEEDTFSPVIPFVWLRKSKERREVASFPCTGGQRSEDCCCLLV